MPPARLFFWLSTAAAAVLVLRSVIARPPPLGVAVVALHAYVAFLLVGVFVLRLRVFADAVVRGPRGARGVVLTFDDGPDPTTTPAVLEALASAQVTATFFVIGRKAEAHPTIVKSILAGGHSVGLHSYAHDRLFSLRSAARIRRDLERGIEALVRITGQRPRLFRPPVGHTQPSMVSVADALGLTIVGWSVSARDGFAWVPDDRVLLRLRRGLADGAIVLLHDASEGGTHVPASVRVLPAVLDALHEKRLEVVPLATFLDEA